MLPAPSFLLVEPLDETTPFKRASKDEITKKATVLLVGGDSNRHGFTMISPAKVGDVILHTSFGYQDFEHEGKKYRVVRFDDVLMIL